MLSSILGWLGVPVINAIFAPFLDIAKAYINKEVSEIEAKQRMVQTLTGAVAQVEVAHAESLSKTYASFMDAAKSSVLMQSIWATVTLTQLFVLIWHQMGIPALVYFGHGPYPSSGSTVEWAYALVGACVGLGPMIMRTGPAASNWVDNIKSLIGKK